MELLHNPADSTVVEHRTLELLTHPLSLDRLDDEAAGVDPLHGRLRGVGVDDDGARAAPARPRRPPPPAPTATPGARGGRGAHRAAGGRPLGRALADALSCCTLLEAPQSGRRRRKGLKWKEL